MIIEFDNSYTELRPVEKMYIIKITGKINSIKYVQELQAAVPEIINDRLEFVIGGEIYTLDKIRKCKIRHKKNNTPIISEVASDNIDGTKMSKYEMYELLNQWMKEDD